VQGVEIPFGFLFFSGANMYRREMMRYVIRRLFLFVSFFVCQSNCESKFLSAVVVGSRLRCM
jgi:hypothetical protein